MQKVKAWAKNNKETIVSCGIIFFAMLIIFVWKGFWPFGKQSFAVFDLSNQIVPLASLIIDFFQGKASLFYTNRLACGMNTFASMIYFIVSPLYLLLFLGGRSNMLYMVNLVIVAYFLCMTMAINYMMKKLFKLKSYLRIIISVAYCFGGYILQNYTFVVWLNYFVILPLLIVSFKQLVDTKKYMKFSILTFIYIISCFGIGTTTHFVLLAIYYLYVLLCVEKSRRKEVLTRLTIALMIGVLFSSFVLIPVGFSAMIGTRTGQLFDYMFTTKFDRGIEIRMMMLMLEFFFTIINIFFIIFSNKKDNSNKFLSIVLAGLIFIHFVDVCSLLLNFGINNGYFTRLNFIYSVITIVTICKFINDFSWEKNVQEQVDNTKNRKYLKCLVLVLTSIVVVVLTVAIIIKKDYLTSLEQNIACAIEEQQNWQSISFLFISALVIFTIIFALFKFKKIDAKIIRITMAIFLSFQAFFGVVMMSGNNYRLDSLYSPMMMTKEIDYYDRVEYSVNNSKLLFDTSGISVFTSMLPKKTQNCYSALGYSTKFNFVANSGGTLFTNSILGIKYSLTYNKKNSRTHTLIDSDTYDNNGFVSNCYLYQYKYSTTGAFLIDNGYQWDNSKNVFENQNLLAKAMGATEDIFEVYDLETLIRNKTGKISVSLFGVYRTGDVYTTYENEDGQVVFFMNDTSENVYYLQLTDGCDKLYKGRYEKNTNPLKTYNVNSGLLNIPKNTSWDFSKIYFAKLNYDKYESQLENIRKNQIDIDYYSNGCRLNVSTSENKKLFVSNVNIEGMKAKINGTKVAVYDIATGFVGVDLKTGENKIDIYYSSPFVVPSILISIVCIGLAVLIICLYNKGKLNWINKFIDYLYVVYVVCFVCVMFVFSGVVTLIKLF